ERAAALAMLDVMPGKQPKTLGADKAYDTQDFIANCRERNVTPFRSVYDVAKNVIVGTRVGDGRTGVPLRHWYVLPQVKQCRCSHNRRTQILTFSIRLVVPHLQICDVGRDNVLVKISCQVVKHGSMICLMRGEV
ncbi:MAG: hypothetical protein ACREV9_16370, partial [Burkholderiales bacterium]